MKRILQPKIGLLLFTILLLTAVLFWWFRSATDLWQAVPGQTAIVLKMDSLQIPSNAEAVPPLLQQLQADATFLNNLIAQQPLLAALQNAEVGQFVFLYIFKQSASVQRQQITEETTYRNQTVQIVTLDGQIFAVAECKGLTLMARQSILVERAIDALKDGQSDWASNNFVQTYSTGSAEILVHTANLRRFLAPYLKSEEEVSALSRVLPAIQLSLAADSSGVRRGKMAIDKVSFWRKLTEQTALDRSALQGILSKRTDLALALQFSQTALMELEENTVLKEYFAPWMHGHVSVGKVETYGDLPQAGFFAIFKMAEGQSAEQALLSLAEAQGALESYRYQMFEVRQLLLQRPLRPLLGERLANLQNPYYTIVEDYVIFCNSKNTLERLVTDILVSEVLANDPAVQTTQQGFADTTTIWLYGKLNSLLEAVERLWRPSQLAVWQQEKTGLTSSQRVVAQLQLRATIIDVEIAISQLEFSSETASIVERIPLPTRAISAPQFFQQREGEGQLLVQDVTFTLHCFSQNGQALWALPLESKILGRIHGISFYQNGQQQYVFNTADRLYILDADGEVVGAFPLNLQTKAAQEVTVIDFDKTRNYSFFVPCENGSVYGFDETGEPVPNWNPLAEVGQLANPMLHFQHDGKDFIILAKDTILQVLQRDATPRFPPLVLQAQLVPPVQFQVEAPFPRIVAGLENGKVLVVALDGSSFHLPLQLNQRPQQFVFADVWGDARKDYIALYDNAVQLWGYDARNDFNRRWSWSSETPIENMFKVAMPRGAKARIGVLCPDKKQIFLLDENGQLVEGFPLAGTTPFQIAELYQNGAPIAVVAQEDVLLCYRLPDG